MTGDSVYSVLIINRDDVVKMIIFFYLSDNDGYVGATFSPLLLHFFRSHF